MFQKGVFFKINASGRKYTTNTHNKTSDYYVVLNITGRRIFQKLAYKRNGSSALFVSTLKYSSNSMEYQNKSGHENIHTFEQFFNPHVSLNWIRTKMALDKQFNILNLCTMTVHDLTNYINRRICDVPTFQICGNINTSRSLASYM